MSELLYKYYDRISKPEDRDVLGNWEVWVYGSDRESFPPHCHVRLPKEHLEFEVSLLTWDVINIKNSDLPNSWDSIDKSTKDGFFEWLNRPSKTDSSISNKKYVYYMWDSLNTENGLTKWVNKGDKDNLDRDLVDCLGWNIDYKLLSRNVIGALSEISFQDREQRKKSHELNPQELLKVLGMGVNIIDDDTALNVVKQAETNVYIWSQNI